MNNLFINYLNSLKPHIDNKIIDFLPDEFNDTWMKENLGEIKYCCDQESVRSTINPIRELLKRGGKRWRPALMIMCSELFSKNRDIHQFIPVIELLHSGTLIVDDIEDDSEERRGKPCIHDMFGRDVAINSGNMMYFLPYLAVKNSSIDDKSKLLIHQLIAEEMIKLHLGQGLDIHWHNNNIDINESNYLQMCAFKTGTLARIAARIGALLGNATEKQNMAVADFAESIGIAFQIQDDILCLTRKDWGKKFGDDISEGKKTLMVIRVLKVGSEADRKRLCAILDLKTKNAEHIGEAIRIIKKYHAIEYAKAIAEKIVSEAWMKVDSVIKTSEAKEKLRLFSEFVVAREL